MTSTTCILGIQITSQGTNITRVQEILTKYGCSIRTRLGLHDPEAEGIKGRGLILLEIYAPAEETLKLENELLLVAGVQVRKMVF